MSTSSTAVASSLRLDTTEPATRDDIRRSVARRRTFAIISHPDAGKTTVTEKLLLFGNAIKLAGTVKARKSRRHAASDWMAMEKERGISVTTSVMQFDYDDRVVNLLDTPGHEDFSEDTYRTLTAVDAALMVIDAAKGVEPRTVKLLEVCRLRDTPIVTFINKLDREVRDPIELIDEIEDVLQIECAPVTWPIGAGRSFRGVYHLGSDRLIRYTAGVGDRVHDYAVIDGLESDAAAAWLGDDYEPFRDEVELLRGASHPFDERAFREACVRRSSSAPRLATSACANVSTSWSGMHRLPVRATRSNDPWRRAKSRSRGSSSRSKRTWTRDIATAWPSCAYARAATGRACVSAMSAWAGPSRSQTR